MKLVLLMAMSLDGRTALHPAHFPDWTEKADKRLFVEVTRRAGVVIMGSRTYDTIGRPLPGRKNVILTRDPARVSHQDNLLFTSRAPREILDTLAAEGHAEAVLAGGATVNTLFAREDLIDEMIVTIAPRLFGQGLSLFEPGVEMSLRLLSVDRLGEQMVQLRYARTGAR